MSETHEVEIQRNGTTETVEVDGDETVLEAAEDAGIELPNSCRTGSCTSCVARVEEGEVEQTAAMGLDPGQKDDGYALLCVAEPRSDCLIVPDVQDELFEIEV